MIASDYPITFPYGATDDTYYGPKALGKPTYIGPYHRGDDRYMPVGTPVVVNGLQIGLSGMSGAVSGPHLHIGKFESGVDVNPKGGGFTIPQPAHVQAIGEDPVNGKYIQIVDATAMLWCYLHLSRIDVTERQLVKESDMPTVLIQPETVKAIFKQYGVTGTTGVVGEPSDEQIQYYGVKGYTQLYEDVMNDLHNRLIVATNSTNASKADPDGQKWRDFKESLGL